MFFSLQKGRPKEKEKEISLQFLREFQSTMGKFYNKLDNLKRFGANSPFHTR